MSTLLKSATDSYTVTLPQNTMGIGRFYLRFSDRVTTATLPPVENP